MQKHIDICSRNDRDLINPYVLNILVAQEKKPQDMDTNRKHSGFIKIKRTVTLILFAGLFLPAAAQDTTAPDIPVDEITGQIIYQEVVPEEGTKRELFNRASEWLHQFFANPVYVTKVRDASSGVIKGKHQFELEYTDDDGNIRKGAMIIYDFRIECRDGRYRYTIDNLLRKQASRYPLERWLDKTDPYYNSQWEAYLEQVDHYIRNDFAASLKEAMEPEPVIEEEEW